MRPPILLAVMVMVFLVRGNAQDLPENVLPAETNSITQLLMERPPELQAGYLSDDDRWLLYSARFDHLSAFAQKFLLEKYGYGPQIFGPFSKPGTPRFQALVHGKSSDILAPGTNVKVVTSDEIGTRLQSETSIAISGQSLVVSYNDDPGSTVSYSRDGGTTWRPSHVPALPGRLGGAGDGVVAAGPNGRFYYANLAPNALGLLNIGVSRSDDGGATWSAPIQANATVNSSQFSNDKEWIAVDNNPGSAYRGYVYVAWIAFSAANNTIRIVRSADGGQTWTPAVTLVQLNPSEVGEVIQGAFVTTGPNGEVYVAWLDSRVNGIRIRKSLDGAVTFSNPVTALAPVNMGVGYFSTGNFEVFVALPQVAVDTTFGPNRGTVYVTANGLTAPRGGNLDVLVSASRDGGNTWEPPVRANNDATTTDQFMPAIAVAADGAVGVAFYDRRNDPQSNSLVDVYLATSTDGGRTFPVNRRVTTANWPVLPTPIFFRNAYHGDYNQVAALGNSFYMSWADDRSGLDPDVYVAVMPSTGDVPDFPFASTRASADVLPGGSAQFSFNTGDAAQVVLSATAPAPGLSFQSSGNTLTVNTMPSTAPGTYSIQVSGTNGAVLRSTVVRLTVHSAGLRQLPVAVTSMRDPSFQPHAFADGAGNVHVVMGNDIRRSPYRRISYLRIPAGGGAPAAPQTVFSQDLTINEQILQDFRVTADPAGRVYVVLRRNDRNGSHILMSRSDDGRSFSTVDVSQISLPSTTAFSPAIAAGNNGVIFVAFILQILSPPNFATLASRDVYLTKSTDRGQTFSTPVNVSRLLSSTRAALLSSGVSLTLDAGDNPHLAWVNQGGTPQDVYYARSRDGGATFDPVVNVSAGTSTSVNPREPSVIVDVRNNIYVAWTNPDVRVGQQDILLARSTDGVQFTTINNISYAGFWSGSIADRPVLGVDGNGILTCAWRQSVPNPLKTYDVERDIFYSRSTDRGLNFSPPVNLSTDLGDTLQWPSLTVDNGGGVYIFWEDDTSGGSQIMMLIP